MADDDPNNSTIRRDPAYQAHQEPVGQEPSVKDAQPVDPELGQRDYGGDPKGDEKPSNDQGQAQQQATPYDFLQQQAKYQKEITDTENEMNKDLIPKYKYLLEQYSKPLPQMPEAPKATMPPSIYEQRHQLQKNL